jgi:dipeptidyl aminopeptidase/acylaminoacyl peptidase
VIGEIWTIQVDGTAPTQMTHLRTGCHHPRWSPDGRSITFAATASGTRYQHIYMVDAADGLLRQLTSGSGDDNWPTWSHDGRWVYFMSDDKGALEIWKVPIGGGPPVQVTTGGAVRAWESSDGRFLYYSTSRPALWRMPVGGGTSDLVLEFPRNTAWGGEWVPATKGIYWMNFDAQPRPSIEFFDFATWHVTRVFTPPGDYDVGGGFSVSKDESWLVFGQRDYFTSDIMMIDQLR